MPLPDRLESDFQNALRGSQNLSSGSIKTSFLSVYIRVARADAPRLDPVIDILLRNMRVNGLNNRGSLYCLARLASQSNEARRVVRDKLPDDFLDYYSSDDDSSVGGNARVLAEVLDGRDISEFTPPRSTAQPTSITYNIGNVGALHSPGAQVHMEIDNTEGLDEETRQLLQELKEALENRDQARAKSVLGSLADKGTDLIVNLVSGVILKQIGG